VAGSDHPGSSAQGDARGAFLVRDMLDDAIRSRDRRRLGRVTELELELGPDNSLRVTYVLLGVEAHVGRIAHPLRRFLARFLKGRFEKRVPVSEIEEIGPTVRLRGMATDYDLDSGDRWVARKLLRFIPGNGGPVE
jgi:hypothetical protein